MPPRLTLLQPDVATLDAALAGRDELARALQGAAVAEGWEVFGGAMDATRDALARDPGGGRWGTRLFMTEEPRTLVGWGGFKGPPGDGGVVELGYAVAPAHRRRGIASEAVRQLLADAWSAPGVRAVIAHTLPERNPSTMVLEHAGFAFDGEAEEGGEPVWRWRAERP